MAGADTIEHGTRLDEETLALMKLNGTILVPTLSTMYSVLELGRGLDLLEKQREEMMLNAPLWRKSMSAAHEAGVRIAVGGDVGNRYPHSSNARELEFLVKEYVSSLEAIAAATSVSASAIGLESEVGSIESGRLVDLLLVDGDPAARIEVLSERARIAVIVRGGRPLAGTLVKS